jgi:hypothetical protein
MRSPLNLACSSSRKRILLRVRWVAASMHIFVNGEVALRLLRVQVVVNVNLADV